MITPPLQDILSILMHIHVAMLQLLRGTALCCSQKTRACAGFVAAQQLCCDAHWNPRPTSRLILFLYKKKTRPLINLTIISTVMNAARPLKRVQNPGRPNQKHSS